MNFASNRLARPTFVTLTLALAACCLLQALPADAQLCPLPADPIPTGPQGRGAEPYPMFNYDHRYVHSGTHLQGVRAAEKWAGGLIHLPAAGGSNFDQMTGAVIVPNPDPLLPMTATIDFLDPLGTLVGTVVRVIQPEGHTAVAATPLAATFGVGTARVTVSDASPPTLGATLQHTTLFRAPVGGATQTYVDGDRPLSVNNQVPGASSMQQLQKVQDNSTLQWVFPVSVTSPVDFYVANLPWLHVVNPNSVANTIAITLTIFDRTAGTVVGPIPWRTVTLPPLGSLTEVSGPHLPALGTFNLGLYEAFAGAYGTPGLDWDVRVDVGSVDGLPILGDGYMADLIGPQVGNAYAIRMASTMLFSESASVLLSPELSYDRPSLGIPGPGIQQSLAIAMNVGTVDAGPVTIQYFDNSGVQIGAFTVPLLPPNQSLRIQPGSLGYPAVPPTSGFGWMRIIPCQSRMIGWTLRDTFPSTSVPEQYHKTYGEAMLALNGAEPGAGFIEPVNGRIRKVSPFVRVDSTNPFFQWPGYSVGGNFSVANIGANLWTFFSAPGVFCGTSPLYPGLRFGNTSWTYEDSLTFCGGPINLSGRFDHTSGRIEGVDVLGDPLDEYGIPGFARPSNPPIYQGPGDVVPIWQQ